MCSQKPVIEVKSIYKSYDDGYVPAVCGVSFSLEKGKIYALMGSSGCGKSTLLNLIGTLDSPDSGDILYNGESIESFVNDSHFRRDFMGFVFQFHHLIPVLTLCENVEIAMIFTKDMDAKQRRKRAKILLEDMGLESKIDSMATKISGGERQRAAIARALANDPKLILADEPTGNVDTKTSAMILEKLRLYVQKRQSTMLIATHDPQVGSFADTILRMEDGKIINIEENR